MRLRIERDIIVKSPREEWDNLGTMLCWHRRYYLGDKSHPLHHLDTEYSNWDDLENAIAKHEDVAVILPLYLYDHSGITISTTPFSCPWDSGRVGFIYVTKDKVREAFDVKRISKKTLAKVTEILKGEVETYDMYLRGDVWGYVIEEDDGDTIDSCWGFYGEDQCREAGELGFTILNERYQE